MIAPMIRWRRRRLTLSSLLLVLLIVGARAWVRSGGAQRVTGSSPTPVAVERGAARAAVPVLRVVDGDTVEVEIAGSPTPKERVRLLRINTPERKVAGYERATAALKAMVEGRHVELDYETPGHAERDEYGRLLAYVFVDDRNVNLEMVRHGWTRFFTKYGEGRFAAEFRAAEEEARTKHAGLWSDEGWNALSRR